MTSSTDDLDFRFFIERTNKYCAISYDERAVKLVALDVICKYTNAMVRRAFEKRKGWKIIKDSLSAELHWGDYECLNWDAILSGKLRGSSYCTRKGLSRKAQMSKYFNKYISKNPSSPLKYALPFTIVVDTWEAFDDSLTFNLSGDVASFGDDIQLIKSLPLSDRLDWAIESVKELMHMHACPRWILKASTLNKGAGIHLVDSFEGVRCVVHEQTDIREWVLQEYIERPLLFQGRKFHLRVYVLAVGSLDVYVFNKILVLSSKIPYGRGNFSEPLAHITNTAIQTSKSCLNDVETVHLFDDLKKHFIAERNISNYEADEIFNGVLNSVHSLTSEIFHAFKGEFSVFSPLPHCFEHFGLDFIIDENFNVWFLEANPGPDFKQTGANLQSIIGDLIEDTAKICVDSQSCKCIGDCVGNFTKVYSQQWSGCLNGPTMKMF